MTEDKSKHSASYNQHSSGSGDNVAGNKNTYLSIRNITVIILVTGIALTVGIYSYQQYKRQKEMNRRADELRRKEDSLKTAELIGSVKSAYEIKYVTLEGNAIDFLLDSNKITNTDILDVFGSKPLILTTPVTDYLLRLKKQFGIDPAEYANYEVVMTNADPAKREAAKNQLKTIRTLPATNTYDYTEGITASPVQLNDLAEKFGFAHKCIADSTNRGNIYAFNEAADCSRFATKKNIEQLLSCFEQESQELAYLKFYLFTAGKSDFPADFMAMRNEYYFGSDGCDGTDFRIIRLSVPVLKLKVAYIKNTSAEPIRLRDFLFSSNTGNKLRSINEDSLGFGRADTVKYNITLPPGKSLVIPVQAYFQTVELEEDSQHPAGQAGESKLPGYVFGSSVQIQSLWVNDFNFAAAKDYSASGYGFYVNGLAEGGSCPYVFTYDSVQQYFMKERTILYAQNKKIKEGWDTIRLKHFDGRLQVKEIDSETSFIDCIYILASGKNRPDRIYRATNKELLSRDYVYKKLTKGDELMLHFPSFKKAAGDTYYVVSSGYYIPWQ